MINHVAIGVTGATHAFGDSFDVLAQVLSFFTQVVSFRMEIMLMTPQGIEKCVRVHCAQIPSNLSPIPHNELMAMTILEDIFQYCHFQNVICDCWKTTTFMVTLNSLTQ